MCEVHVLPANNVFSGVSVADRSRDAGARSAWIGASRWWFAALDARRLGSGASTWVARVVGIHEVRPHLWIQLESDDASKRIVMHVTLETRLDEAVTAIDESACDASGLTCIDVPRLRRHASGSGVMPHA